MQFITEDGGLTGAGYALFIALAIIAFVVAVILARHFSHKSTSSKKSGMSAKQLAFCAMGLALAYVTSYVKLFEMPYGGSVTLFSMLFIVLVANWYGVGTGLLVGFAYGILQFIQEPYFLTFFQVCCDYLFAFTALGLAGLFGNKKNGLLKGYILGALVRLFFHVLGGYIYWMDYMPESFPQAISFLYPIVYNGSFILAEGVITCIVISIPPVKKALAKVKSFALD